MPATKNLHFFDAASCYVDGVKPLSSTLHGRTDPFAPTHWSVVRAASQANQDPEQAAAALAELCQIYWAPLYVFVRRRGQSPHDAEDLTQGFFAHLIEHRIYERLDPVEGKFRSFLLAAMKNFLANARAREQAEKRGGGQAPLPLHEETVQEAECFYQAQPAIPATEGGADHSFERSWAQALVDTAMKQVSVAYASEGKHRLFTALRPFLSGNTESLPSYEQVAASLGRPVSTVRTQVTRLRAAFREALRVEVRRTVNSEAEVREELAALRRVLTGG